MYLKKGMVDLKFSKKIIVALIFLIIIIYNFFIKKDSVEEFFYNDMIVENMQENIVVEEISNIKVYVTGEVNNPGVIELPEGSRIEDAINSSNGLTELANLSEVNLAYTLEDGQKLYIPSINDKQNTQYISLENGEKVIETEKSSSSKVNINKANIDELKNLPGVGDALAQRIITYRNEIEKFKNIEDLKNVSGIGEKKYDSLKEYIDV